MNCMLSKLYNREIDPMTQKQKELSETEEQIKTMYEENLPLAKEGNLEALFQIAEAYRKYASYYDDDTVGNEAVVLYQNLADQGHGSALCQLGHFYDDGEYFERDKEKAAEFFRKAANVNCAEGYYFLGSCFANGDGVSQDDEKSFKAYLRSAELEDAGGMAKTGILYYEGKGVKQDYNQAYFWLQKAYLNSEDWGLYYLGVCYLNGLGTTINEKKGFQILERANEQFCYKQDEARKLLISCYEKGIGTEKSWENGQKIREKIENEQKTWDQIISAFIP